MKNIIIYEDSKSKMQVDENGDFHQMLDEKN